MQERLSEPKIVLVMGPRVPRRKLLTIEYRRSSNNDMMLITEVLEDRMESRSALLLQLRV